MMNSMKTNMSDVHFWIEEDNKIIDWDFSIYDSIKKSTIVLVRDNTKNLIRSYH